MVAAGLAVVVMVASVVLGKGTDVGVLGGLALEDGGLVEDSGFLADPSADEFGAERLAMTKKSYMRRLAGKWEISRWILAKVARNSASPIPFGFLLRHVIRSDTVSIHTTCRSVLPALKLSNAIATFLTTSFTKEGKKRH